MFHSVGFSKFLLIFFCFSVIHLQKSNANASIGENFLLGKYAHFYPGSDQETSVTDGNVTTFKATSHANHFAWIAVDMEQFVEVSSVHLIIKEHNNQSTSFSIFVADKFFPCDVNSVEFRSTWKLCKSLINVYVTNNDTVVHSSCQQPVTGQYVILMYGDPYNQQLQSMVLSFYEIEAFGLLKIKNDTQISKKTDLIFKDFDMKTLMPIRQFIMGDNQTIFRNLIRLLKDDKGWYNETWELYFHDSSSESLLWDPDTSKHHIVASKIGKGRVITFISDKLSNYIMSEIECAQIWKAMKTWLGNEKSKIRNINDDYDNGDIVLSSRGTSHDKLFKAFSKMKSGEISLILVDFTMFGFENLYTNAIYELKWNDYVKFFLSSSFPHIDKNGTNCDLCALSLETLLQNALEYPQILAKCHREFLIFEMLSSTLASEYFNASHYQILTLNVLLKYDAFVNFHQPCKENNLKINSEIKDFIDGYDIFMKNSVLINSGFKAPGADTFDGDIPSFDIVRENVTFTIDGTLYNNNYTSSIAVIPTGIYLPAGETITLTVTSKDFQYIYIRIQIGCSRYDMFRKSKKEIIISKKREKEVSQVLNSPFGGYILLFHDSFKYLTKITFVNALQTPSSFNRCIW